MAKIDQENTYPKCSKKDCWFCYMQLQNTGKVTEEGILKLGLAKREKGASIKNPDL